MAVHVEFDLQERREGWLYNTSKDGYWSEWVDSTPAYIDGSHEIYSSRYTGYFVPPASGDYMLFVLCDDRCKLYLSNTTQPEDKV
ncbi:hypothetical protein CRUP_026227 [Coryphaenoides rupestris]|nr:hypothetical protein CRUP_026227 [Coryphaenoides rupestris]